MYLYIPAVVNPVIVVVGEDGVVMVDADGLPGMAVHEAPVKAVAAIVAVSPAT